MTYTALLAQVASWLNRTDLTAVIPDFVRLTEERINRTLRVRQMEAMLDMEPVYQNALTIPADTLEPKTLWVEGYESTPLHVQSFESAKSHQTAGIASLYAWNGSELYVNGSGVVSGVLYKKIPALATNSTNWLLETHPSVYLFGALMEAALYAGGDASMWQSRFESALSEIHGNDKRYNGPLVARAR